MACYTGPAGTLGVGLCTAGVETCDAQGTGYGACAGEVTPAAEDCEKPGDQACLGLANNGCGKALWSHDFGEPNAEEGYATAVDPLTDEVVIGGYIDGDVDFGCGPVTGNANNALFVTKLDAAGNCVWSNAWGAGATAEWLVVDPSGDIYVSGTVTGTLDLGCGALTGNAEGSALVAKMSSTGACLWSKVFGDDSAVYVIALDSASDLILAGAYVGTIDFGGGSLVATSNQDSYVAALDANGNYLWARHYGASGGASAASSLVADGMNDVFVGGQYQGTVDLGCGPHTHLGLIDAYVAKLGPTGACLWSRSYGAAGGQDHEDAFGLDSAGNLVMVGEFTDTVNLGGNTLTSLGIYDIFLAKLDTNGNHLWSESFGGSGDQYHAYLAVDASDAIVVSCSNAGTASFGGPMLVAAGTNDVAVAKYDSAGAYIWSAGFGETGNQSPRQTVVDGAGDILISGLSAGTVDFGNGPLTTQGGEDIFVVKLAP